MSTKYLLNEAYKRTKKLAGVNPALPNGFKQVLADRNAWSVYTRSLAEGLTGDDYENFLELADSTRLKLMENSMYQINPYETLSMPVLRVFYPKLIARELVNVMPINQPDVVFGFIKAYFGGYKDKVGGTQQFPYPFPSVNNDISRGPGVTVTSPGTANVGVVTNIFDVIDTTGGLSPSNAHIEKDFFINKVYSGADSASVAITPTVDGNFSANVVVGGNADVISGHVNFEKGELVISSLSGVVDRVDFVAYVALEENQINPVVRFEIEKIRLTVIDRRISAEWSLNLEQDAKALFDVTLQSELVNIVGEQLALDIDREIVNKLIHANASMNPPSHTKSFNKTPPAWFTWGQKMWYENIIPVLNELSAQVYNSCLIGSANTLACNPLDASIFESLNDFRYAGNSVDGGDVGYRSAEIQGGKWKILVSSIVPQGTVITKYRSNDISRAVFVYAPYVPSLLTPYPLGPIPSLTIMSRYATRIIRNNGLAVLNIVS